MKQSVWKNILTLTMMQFVIASSFVVLAQEDFLSPKEQAYVQQKQTIKASAYATKGGAPIIYEGPDGEIKGLAFEVLAEIEKKTGLVFEVSFVEDSAEVKNSDAEVFLVVSNNYNTDNFALETSVPFLVADSSIFVNKYASFVTQEDLKGKRFADIKGSNPPTMMDDFELVYFDSREEVIKAVNSGRADLGIENDFSLAYYMAQGKYDNLSTIPVRGLIREYALAYLVDDPMMIQIIDKAIEDISDAKMQSMILSLITEDVRQSPLVRFIRDYTELIWMGFMLLFVWFIYLIRKLRRSKDRIYTENQRYSLLSEFSGEFIFDYDLETKELKHWGNKELYNRSIFPREIVQNQVIKALLSSLENREHELCIFDKEGHQYCIWIKQFVLYDKKNKPISIFGSFLDVSEERKNLEKLEYLSRMDGLTNLYNNRYTKEIITKQLREKDKDTTDAFLIVDLDNFKQVNDYYGHLKGDQTLQEVAEILKDKFSDAFAIGRYGGDEFCIYLSDIKSCQEVKQRADALLGLVQKEIGEVKLSATIGISLVSDETEFEDIFQKADKALYFGKDNQKAESFIYQENEAGIAKCPQ